MTSMVLMNRLGNKIFSSAIALVVAFSVAACSGGGTRGTLPQPVPTSSSSAAAYNGPLASVTFTFRIPGPSTSANARRPLYVSSATKSIKLVLNTSSTLTVSQVTAYNLRPWGTINVGTLPNATCPASGSDFVCTVAILIPPGSDNLTFSLYDNTNATGNILSQQIQTLTVTVGTSNSFNVIFDANANIMTVNGSGSCQNGPVGAVFGSVGTVPVTFSVAYTDAKGKTIVAPGLPKLEIQDNTAIYQTASGTINGTGGTVAFTINQAAQTFTLTPSNSTTTNASVNVKAVQADSTGSSDGLAFSKTQSFAFSTGTAPPASNFLSAVEQIGTNTGQVDFFNVSLGGSGGPDTFSAFSPATLAVTNSTNESKPDVDNPLSLAWDSNGDLLIGNGHNGGADTGNMACVPVGASATGANTATTVSTNVTSPFAIAYDPRDGSVALADKPAGAPVQLSEYLLTGNYTAAPGTGAGTRNLVAAGLGDDYVVNLPTQTAGSYAAALTDGCEVDPAHKTCGGGTITGISKIAMLSPTGVETDIANPTSPTTFAIDMPFGLAWDAQNAQLVIANNSVWHPSVSFYSLGPTAQQKVVTTLGADGGPRKDTLVAASPDGHVAVAQLSSAGSGYMLVQVYDNTASRNPVGGPIPFNSTSDAGVCSNYSFGTDGATVQALTWLSNTKLLIAVLVTSGGVYQATNGLYIYDISATATPAGFNDETCTAYLTAPKQSGFQHLSKTPFGVAFKP